MAYVTYDQLRSIPLPLRKSDSEIIKEASASARGKHVFLAHSNRDSRLLAHAINLFERKDASVYLDLSDQTLLTQDKVSVQTASLLRTQIQRCPRFVLVASMSIRSSRWTPWELGFADGQKGVARIALLPLVPGPKAIPSVEQEYLDLYPRIEFDRLDGRTTPEYVVRDPRDGLCWRLHDWLHSDIE